MKIQTPLIILCLSLSAASCSVKIQGESPSSDDGVKTKNGISAVKNGDDKNGKKTAQKFTYTYAAADGLADENIESVYVSKDGAIYAATSGGLSVLKKGEKQFKNYTTDQGLTDEKLLDVYGDDLGNIYARSNAALDVLKKGEEEFKPVTYIEKNQNNKLETKKVEYQFTAFVTNVGKIYLKDSYTEGTLENGGTVYIRQGNVRSFSLDDKEPSALLTTQNGLPTGDISKIFVDEEGNIYCSFYKHGIWLLKKSENKFNQIVKVGDADEDDIHEIFVRNGNLVFSSNHGVSVLKKGEKEVKTYTREDGLPHDLANTVFIDKNDTVYATTALNGLSIMKKDEQKFSNYNLDSGLGSFIVNSIFVDDNGVIYAGTAGGLSVGK